MGVITFKFANSDIFFIVQFSFQFLFKLLLYAEFKNAPSPFCRGVFNFLFDSVFHLIRCVARHKLEYPF